MRAEAEARTVVGVRLVAAVVVATSVGLVGANLQPMLLGAIIDGLGLSPGEAGFAGSVELGAMAVVTLLLAPRVASLSRSRLALMGAVVTVLGYAFSAAATSFEALLVARLFTGLGEGAVLAAGNAAAASSSDPDRLWAFVVVFGGLVAALIMGTIPLAIGPWKQVGGFVVVAVFCLLCLPGMRLLPPAPAATVAAASSALPHPGLGVLTLLAILLAQIGESGLWAFSERLGLQVELSAEAIGLVLGGATLAGVGGAAAAAVLSTRSGRVGPLAVGILVTTVARCAVVYATTPAVYVASQLVWGISYLFVLPYFLGTVAALDRFGRWSAAAGGAMSIGVAIGPGVAGWLASDAGYGALGVLMAATGLASLLLVVPVALVMDRRGLRDSALEQVSADPGRPGV
jgi:predicted MFS family arabinose efflux permease